MALDQSALLELLGELKLTDVTDRIRVATETLYQELIDAEAAAFIGAAPFERTPDRVAQRNGTRTRALTTTAGELELKIPKLRQGSFFPSLLERRRRVDQALFAVVMEAYVHGVSTRKVDDLVKALGAGTGISKSEVSRICANLDEDVAAFRDRPLADTTYPYVFLDATYCKARVGRRVVSQAVVVAVGVAADGRREVLGFEVGETESQPFWTSFLIRTYAWIFILGGKGLPILLDMIGIPDVRFINTPFAVLVGIIYGYLPLMVFPIFVSLERLDKRLLEASDDLGASPARTFWQITLPLSAPGAVTGCMLVFILLMGEYLIPALLGGGKVFFIGNALVDLFLQSRNWPFGSAVAVSLVIIMLVTVTLYLRVTLRNRGMRDQALV